MKILLALAMTVAFFAGSDGQEQPFRFTGAACVTPPPLHCPDADCPSDRVINQGPVVEMKTRRTYFLDYPCDLKPGEKVTFILSLHGAGSYGNWQRHYFPIVDLKDKHRLVIATPNSPTRTWTATDDEYLQNIVEFVIGELGRERIASFWLAGHSQGGMTSNRLLRTDYFKNMVDGWLSLSGGRLGGQPGRVSFGNVTPSAAARGGAAPAISAQAAALSELPSADFSFIYTTGEREIDAKGVPPASAWAAKYGCGARGAAKEIVDTKGGYIYDRSRQNPPNPAWGLLPGPGTAHVMTYAGCRDGRVIADVVRLAKGHTEGLEPNVTEELVRLMLSARGGKLSAFAKATADKQAAASTQGRALAIEDYYRIKTVGDPQISPNGRWVAYTVSTRVEEDNTNAIETYVVATDSAATPRRITHEGRDVASPRWTDDNLLEYTLNARVDSAVFVGGDRPRERPEPAARFKVAIDTPGATPVASTASPAGVLSADGKSRALARDLPRAPAPEITGTDFEKRHAARFKGRTFDWMRFQQDGQDYPTADPRLRPAAEITVTAADGSNARALTALGLRPSNVAWHPNGSTIAFTADENWRSEQTYESPDIYVASQGAVTRLTNDGYVWSALAYSPDGRFLLAERTFGTGMIIDQKLSHGGADDLILWPIGLAAEALAKAAAPINLTEKWDLEPNAPRWSADGGHVYFTAEKSGTTHVFRIAARPGATVEQVTTGDRRLGSVTFDKAMTRMAYTVGTYDSPSDVWTARIDGSGERRLTDVHADLRSAIGITRTERISWKSADGTVIEGFLTMPYGYNRAGGSYPLVVFNHGGPHSSVGPGFNFKQQYFAANGYFVLDTNFRSSTGYGDAFKWATWGAWGNKDGQDVIAGVDHVIANYPVDRSRVASMGHSYGGFMTNWLITQYPDRFAAAASGAGISNWISDYGTADIYRTKETEFFGTPWNPEAVKRMVAQSPLMQSGRVRTPTLFVQGEMDQRVPYEESEQMYFALRRQGVPAKMIAYAGQPHGISGHWNNVHRMLNELKWIDSYLKPKAQTTSARP
jgi:dipeptidyl aminopeptidase/acylaminoacyl peptidase